MTDPMMWAIVFIGYCICGLFIVVILDLATRTTALRTGKKRNETVLAILFLILCPPLVLSPALDWMYGKLFKEEE